MDVYQMYKYEKAIDIIENGISRFIEFVTPRFIPEKFWQIVIMNLILLPEYWLELCYIMGHRILCEYNYEKYHEHDRRLFYERENFK